MLGKEGTGSMLKIITRQTLVLLPSYELTDLENQCSLLAIPNQLSYLVIDRLENVEEYSIGDIYKVPEVWYQEVGAFLPPKPGLSPSGQGVQGMSISIEGALQGRSPYSPAPAVIHPSAPPFETAEEYKFLYDPIKFKASSNTLLSNNQPNYRPHFGVSTW